MRKVITILTMMVLVACQANASQLPASISTAEPAEVIATTTLPAAISTSTAAPPIEPEPDEMFDSLFRSVTGTVDAVYVRDKYVYLNVGPILVILDVSDPQSLHPLGAIKLPVETIAAITVKDGYAYVAAAEAGLRIVDISDPAQPVEVGVYQPPLPGKLEKNFTGSSPAEPPEALYYRQGARTVAVEQSAGEVYAYVAALGAGLRVVKVSDPTQPVEVGIVAATEGGVVDVAIANKRAYVVNPNVGLQIVDISEPTRPEIIGSTPAGWGFAVSYDQVGSPYVYVAYGSCSVVVNECPGGVHIIDITHSAAPQTFLASEPVLYFSTNLAVSGQRAYVLTTLGLSVLNISDPLHPQVESYDALVTATDINIIGETLYLATGVEGLQIFDFSDPAAPELVSQWQPIIKPGQEPLPKPSQEPPPPPPTQEP